MKNTVLNVTDVIKDEEHVRITLEGSDPYFSSSEIILVLEYKAGRKVIPDVGEQYILGLTRWKDVLRERQVGSEVSGV